MRALFVHQNAPGQYAHIIRRLVAVPGNEIVVLTQSTERHVPGARTVVYPVPPGSPTTGVRNLATTETALRNGEAVLETALRLKRDGFRPDVMVGHNAWGETLFLKDVWPDVPLLSYFEFYYQARGADCGFDLEFPSDFNDFPRCRILNTINLLGLEAADWGHSPTLWQWSRFPERHRQRISVFHEGVDTRTIRPNPRIRLQLPNGGHVGPNDEVITYVSRSLEPYRGFHVFMRALPEILRRRPRAQVIVVGGDDTSYGPKLGGGRTFREALLEEVGDRLDRSRIHFMGRVPRAHFTAILQASAVHVYLTYPFVLSWSMIEAMSAGCLVLGSSTPPVQEVIRDGENGLLVDFFDTRRIADRIDEVLDHPDRMADLRRRARQTALECYDIETVCLPQIERVLADLVAGRTPPAGPLPLPEGAVAPARQGMPQGNYTVADAMVLARQAEARGDAVVAEGVYRQLIDQRPEMHEALYALGLLLYKARRFPEAVACVTRAVAVMPENATYHADLGVMHKAVNHQEERMDCYKRALALDPGHHATLMNLGSALIDLGDEVAAETACRHALAVIPGHYGSLSNLANALARLRRLDEAIEIYRQIVMHRPHDADANRNLGICLLLRGDLAEGAAHYEYRMESPEIQPREFTEPRWHGEPLGGRTVLLHAEQGLGDTLQFCRYATMVKARGGRVLLEAHRSLVPLLQGLEGADRIVTFGEPLPAFDVHCPLLSLMKACGTELATIPAKVPYLFADPARRDAWAGRLTRRPGALQVGLVWAGNPTHLNDRHRSLPLELLKPHIQAMPEVDFHSLQVGPARQQIAALGLSGPLPDLGGEVKDFADTAALVDQLDLLISVDTSIVHLAGALGRPVWTMVTFAPDWRWLLGRDDSPWYPSLRLFRQDADRRWEPVLERAFAELAAVRPSVR